MNSLREAVNNYIEMRRKLGYRLAHAGYLIDFVSFMEERNAPSITAVLAVEWAQKPTSIKPVTQYNRLTVVRSFARFRAATDPRTEIPAVDLLPHRPKRAIPYIFSEVEIKSLLQAALLLPDATSLTRRTYHCLFGLLFVSGLRISEAIGLKILNVDLTNGILKVESAKTGRLRLIPLHESTRQVLWSYKLLRGRMLKGTSCEFFFVSDSGTKLSVETVRNKFYVLLPQCGLPPRVNGKGPRLHDTRHHFAINTLLRWHRLRENSELVLPALATVLGHSNVNDTYWYLSACPELMGAAVQRLDEYWRERTL